MKTILILFLFAVNLAYCESKDGQGVPHAGGRELFKGDPAFEQMMADLARHPYTIINLLSEIRSAGVPIVYVDVSYIGDYERTMQSIIDINKKMKWGGATIIEDLSAIDGITKPQLENGQYVVFSIPALSWVSKIPLYRKMDKFEISDNDTIASVVKRLSSSTGFTISFMPFNASKYYETKLKNKSFSHVTPFEVLQSILGEGGWNLSLNETKDGQCISANIGS